MLVFADLCSSIVLTDVQLQKNNLVYNVGYREPTTKSLNQTR